MADTEYLHDQSEEGQTPLFSDDEQSLCPEDLDGVPLPGEED
ncbi:hypothetical protein ACGF5F_29690 [Streptomyces sp. NPDC047821]